MNNLNGKHYFLLAITFLYLKTVIAYHVSFDIKIESLFQEVILLINPLSSVLFFLGLTLFFGNKHRQKFIILSMVIATSILYSNIVYYRFFNDFITLPVLFQTSNMGDLGGSIFGLIKWYDLLYFIDILVVGYGLSRNKAEITPAPAVNKLQKQVFLVAAVALVINLGLAEIERPQLLTRTFDREMLVKNLGTYNYHVYDIVLQSKSRAQRAFADSSMLVEIENYVDANRTEPNPELFGIAKQRNVFLISMESTQSFVINNSVFGEEITPFLNEFIKESFYFSDFYHQTEQGKTSDSEFLLDNSLYPLSRGAVFFTHGQNEYNASPEILKEHGYYSAVFHANNKSFWNRDIMYSALEYDRFFAIEDYTVTEENSIGWGLKDIPFFEQSVDHLKTLPQPFYTKFITLTNHFPYELGEEDQMIEEYNSESGTLNRFFTTVRYTDEAIKIFIDKLKEEGLYENSVIIIYGDHYGISENHNKAMSQYLGKEVTPFESVQLQRVPLIVHIPGVTDTKVQQPNDTVSGQIDLRPTIMHLLGISTDDNIKFGTDILSKEKLPFTVLRDGSFITDKYVFTKGVCYEKVTGLETDSDLCEPYKQKVNTELDYSDKIIYGDLLRFFKTEETNNKDTKN